MSPDCAITRDRDSKLRFTSMNNHEWRRAVFQRKVMFYASRERVASHDVPNCQKLMKIRGKSLNAMCKKSGTVTFCECSLRIFLQAPDRNYFRVRVEGGVVGRSFLDSLHMRGWLCGTWIYSLVRCQSLVSHDYFAWLVAEFAYFRADSRIFQQNSLIFRRNTCFSFNLGRNLGGRCAKSALKHTDSARNIPPALEAISMVDRDDILARLSFM